MKCRLRAGRWIRSVCLWMECWWGRELTTSCKLLIACRCLLYYVGSLLSEGLVEEAVQSVDTSGFTVSMIAACSPLLLLL